MGTTQFNAAIVDTVDDGFEGLGSYFDNQIVLGNQIGSATGALRFRNVTVPQGENIVNAEITVEVISAAGDPDVTVRGVLGDCPLFDSGPNRPTLLSQTTAFVAGDVDQLGSIGITVTSLVQEIVNGTWASGDNMGFVISDNGNPGGVFAQLEDLDAAGGNEAMLSITYGTIPPGAPSEGQDGTGLMTTPNFLGRLG